MVEEVDEVASELYMEPFRQWKVLMKAHIHIGISRRSQAPELRRAVSKGTRGRLSEVPVIGEPLAANTRNQGIFD